MARVRMRIKDGVERGLCGSCRSSHIMVDDRGNQTVLCSANSPLIEITRPVAQCNQHRTINEMTEWEANQKGWILEVKGTRIIGFKAPENGELQ